MPPRPTPVPVKKTKPPPRVEKKKAPAAPEILGVLSLVVDPPVRVVWGSKELGTTPLKASLPIGKQTLKFLPPDGPPKTVTVEVKEAGSAARFDLEDL